MSFHNFIYGEDSPTPAPAGGRQLVLLARSDDGRLVGNLVHRTLTTMKDRVADGPLRSGCLTGRLPVAAFALRHLVFGLSLGQRFLLALSLLDGLSFRAGITFGVLIHGLNRNMNGLALDRANQILHVR